LALLVVAVDRGLPWLFIVDRVAPCAPGWAVVVLQLSLHFIHVFLDVANMLGNPWIDAVNAALASLHLPAAVLVAVAPSAAVLFRLHGLALVTSSTACRLPDAGICRMHLEILLAPNLAMFALAVPSHDLLNVTIWALRWAIVGHRQRRRENWIWFFASVLPRHFGKDLATAPGKPPGTTLVAAVHIIARVGVFALVSMVIGEAAWQ